MRRPMRPATTPPSDPHAGESYVYERVYGTVETLMRLATIKERCYTKMSNLSPS